MKSNWSTPFRYVIGILFFVAFVAFLFTAGEAVNALVIAAFSASEKNLAMGDSQIQKIISGWVQIILPGSGNIGKTILKIRAS